MLVAATFVLLSIHLICFSDVNATVRYLCDCKVLFLSLSLFLTHALNSSVWVTLYTAPYDGLSHKLLLCCCWFYCCCFFHFIWCCSCRWIYEYKTTTSILETEWDSTHNYQNSVYCVYYAYTHNLLVCATVGTYTIHIYSHKSRESSLCVVIKCLIRSVSAQL